MDDAGKERLLLTAEGAADALALSRSKMWALLKSGELPSVKIGGSRRIRLSDLRRYVNRLAGEG